MAAYVVRRLVMVIPNLLGITVVIFLLTQLAPGDPVAQYAQHGHMRPEDLERIRHHLGLDQPLYVQYLKWLGRWVSGDWGNSLMSHTPVAEIVAIYMPNSILLAGISFMLAVVMGTAVGIISAVRQYSWLDNFLRAFSFFGLCAPSYWVGLLAIMVFSTHLHLLPGGGMYPPGDDPTLVELTRHLIMPALVGALYSTGMYARYMRSSLLEILGMDHVRTARGKGLRGRTVLLQHGVRNALIPMATVVALNLPWILSGSILIEAIFSWPGMGRYYWVAAQQKDYPVIMSMFTLIAIAVVLSNLLADILYAKLDPRIAYE